MAKTDPQARLIHRTRQLIKLLNVQIRHFPKHEKYGLSLQIRNEMYTLFGLLVECQKRPYQLNKFYRLDVQHERLRMFVNLAFEF